MKIKFKFGYGLYDSYAEVITRSKILTWILTLYLRILGFKRMKKTKQLRGISDERTIVTDVTERNAH